MQHSLLQLDLALISTNYKLTKEWKVYLGPHTPTVLYAKQPSFINQNKHSNCIESCLTCDLRYSVLFAFTEN